MNRWVKISYLSAVFLFLYFPIITIVIYSFNDSSISSQWQGFTWHWYRSLINNHHLIKLTFHSFLLGISAASIATVLGSMAAICLYRYRFYGKQLLHLLIFMLVISPEIVIAISLLLFFSWLKIPLGFISLLLAHTVFCMPYVTITVYSRLLTIDKNLLKAAKELGANEFRIFYQILLPLIRVSILGGWLISFALSLDDVIISFFLSGPEFSILPLEIYSWVRLGIKPELNALCSILLGLTLISVLFFQLLLKPRDE